MKKLVSVVLAVLLLVSAFAVAEPMDGGWTESESPEITDEIKACL